MNLHKTYTVDEAQKKLNYYCSYQERCHKEVRQKLITMRMIPEAIDSIIVSLIRHDFLNESRFCNTFVSGKLRIKKWGKRKLIIELKKRDISTHNINAAINKIPEDEYLQIFHELAIKKEKNLKEPHFLKRKKKLVDYLLYRGWESPLVYEKANELIKK